jgi:hypothetical protein
MADKKISALTAASTPLAGTEVLPIVQSGATVKVAVSDLTAGRAISATSVTASTGNFVVGTSGQGIDFSATSGTGTSELLNDYEEGTWTPTANGFNTVGTVTISGTYLKIGRNVWLRAQVSAATSMAPVYNGGSRLQSLPFSGLQGVATWSVNNAATAVTTTFHDGSGNIYAPTATVGADVQMIMNMFYQV